MASRRDCIYFCAVFCSVLFGNVRSSGMCPPGFKYVESLMPKNSLCVAFFKTAENWERAYNVCRHYSAYLFYHEATDVVEIQKFSNETEKIHIGIKRINGIYLWSDPDPREFSHDNVLNYNESKLLWGKDEPRDDCVGLNLVTKTLYTTSCDGSRHSFVCVGNVLPDPPMVCDEGWKFSYLSGNCIKKSIDKVNYTAAEGKCNEFHGELINYETSKALEPEFLFEAVHSTKNTGSMLKIH
ncbi:uncharacterized protein [Centruroides vittatus]|uniref:uncharacterized protein n=1 Tax=Centruroides vittatus TaxID=120091 RepID=UPI00350F7D2C